MLVWTRREKNPLKLQEKKTSRILAVIVAVDDSIHTLMI